MKLSDVQASNGQVCFVIDGVEPSFVNAIRRLIIDEVPTLAVEDVEIRDNSSALYDEMLAHRIGLIPIKTDLSSYRIKQEPEDDDNAACELKITLKSNKKGIVIAGQAESADPKCKFVHEDMPIVKLLSKQKVEIIATAILGRGKDHTKWSPGIVLYVNYPKLKGGSYPKDIVKGSKIIDLSKTYLLDSQEVEVEENKYVMCVESWGQLSCKEMLSTAAEIMIEKCEQFETAMK